MPRWTVALALALGLSGCSMKKRVKNLSNEEFDHYSSLRVFMDDLDRKAYLRLKTEEERNTWLKDQDLWDRFYKYEPHIRQLIVDGTVQEGWTKDMVYMSWGAPIDRRRLPGRKAERSEMLIYKFEQHMDGSVRVWDPSSKTAYKAVRFFKQEVVLDDDVVKEVRER